MFSEFLGSFAIKQSFRKNEVHYDDRLDEMKILVAPIFFEQFSINKLANHLGWLSGFSKFSFSNNIENQPKRLLESLRYKTLKKKNMIWPNSLCVRADRSDIWLFFWRHYPRKVNCLSTRSDFWILKFENLSMLQANLLTLDRVFRKKGIFHYNWPGKTKNLVKSHFYFSNFYQTKFWVIASVIFNFVRKWNRENQQKCCH